MADYTRQPERFGFTGLSLLPQDALGPGKSAYVKNIRSYEDGTVQPRYGLTLLTSSAAMADGVQSIIRLNDSTPIASVPAKRFVKIATGALYAAIPSATTYGAAVDSGYSGNPISWAITVPVASPQPWIYIGDSARMRKFNINGANYAIGIAPPTVAPTVVYAKPEISIISELDTAGDWAQFGSISAAPSNVTRFSTTISAIVYDAGVTGMASIGATAMTNIGMGSRVTVNAADTVQITDTLIAIASTTITEILYDSGATGACVIVPAGSIGTGQLDGPTYEAYLARTPEGSPWPTSSSPSARVRQIDFPVNCLVRINAGGGTDEVVRIRSVGLGPNGIQSFRCVTVNAHTAGETLAGIAGFRAYLPATNTVGQTLTSAAIQQVLTTTSVASVVGGMEDTTLALNLALVGNLSTLPDDNLHLSFKADLLTYVTEIRLMLDVNATSTNFLDNYLMAVWRANDIVSAVQATATGVPSTVQDARTNAVLQHQIDQPVDSSQRSAAPRDASAPDESQDESQYPAFGGATATQRGYRRGPNSLETGRTAVPRNEPTLTATSRQLALGNNQWIELTAKIRDLIRIGTDPSRTLANVGGVKLMVTLSGYTGAVTVQYDAAYIQGGYGPDTGAVGTPMVYCYRYRSSLTGATSNPSPPTRAGFVPRRMRLSVTPTASADPQADLVDYFRFGAALTQWTYTGTNAAVEFHDDNSDSAIDGGENLRFDLYQPWITVGQPKTGQGTVYGTSLVRTGGDTFDTNWPPGTLITVNGFSTTLYGQPASTTRLQLAGSCGSAANINWTVKEPMIQGQVMPGLWGGPVGGVVYLFGCGDPTDPGSLHWTHGNNPDGTSDRNWLSVTSASEPLQNGFIYDGTAFVFSTDDLYRLPYTPGSLNTFAAQKTPCGRGLWGRWAFCVSPRGVYFLAKDGIYFSQWGASAVNITDPDLTLLFPQEGTGGVTTNDVDAPNMSAVANLQLSYVAGCVYFDYVIGDGSFRTLMYEEGTGEGGRWYFDQYAETVRTRSWERGSAVNNQILGGTSGNLYQYSSAALIDASAPIAFAFNTPWANGGDLRIQKQFGDAVLDFDPNDNVAGLTVTPVVNYGDTALTPVVVGAGLANRILEVINWSSGAGILSINAGLKIVGSVGATDTARPKLYGWEPSFIPKAVLSESRATDWDDLGYQGAKFVQGFVLRANTYGVDKTLVVQSDGGATAITLTINHSGEETKAYPLASAGWDPFVSELVRLVPSDEVAWQFLGIRWVAEPAPEEATQWQTQPTSHDQPGYLSVRDQVIAYSADDEVTLVVEYEDGPTQTYVLPSTSGAYTRAYVVMATGKGRAVTYTWTSDSPFRLWKRDMSVRIQPWGAPSGYLSAQPFGGNSRSDGAAI